MKKNNVNEQRRVDWAFRTLLFVIRYRRGKWLEKRVV